MNIIGKVRRRYLPTLAEQLGYSAEDILVIVSIDDVGMHKDETEAGFRALMRGMVKSASIMVPCPSFHNVVRLWKENPEVDVGIHLTLTCEWGESYPWTPVLSRADVPSLYNPEGIMWRSVAEILQHADKRHVAMELEAQINKALDSGLPLSHANCHMCLHEHLDLLPMVVDVTRKYSLSMRVSKRKIHKIPFVRNSVSSLRRAGHIFPDTQMGLYMLEGQDQSLEFRKAKYHDYLESLKPGVHNIKVHISPKTRELQDIMGHHASSIREIDYKVWTSEETNRLAEKLGITFIDFKRLQQLQIKKMAFRE